MSLFTNLRDIYPAELVVVDFKKIQGKIFLDQILKQLVFADIELKLNFSSLSKNLKDRFHPWATIYKQNGMERMYREKWASIGKFFQTKNSIQPASSHDNAAPPLSW